MTRWAVAIFLVAFCVRLVFFSLDRYNIFATPTENTLVATAFAEGKGIADPYYACPTGLTALIAPAYPALLGAILHASPNTHVSSCAVGFLAIFCSSLAWSLVPRLAAETGLRDSIGVVAGFVGALFPSMPGFESLGDFETPTLTLWCVVATLASIRCIRSGAWRDVVVAGAAWGAAFWFGPTLLTMCFAQVLLAALLLKRRRVAVVLVIAVVAVSPWMVRNYRHFGHVFWIRDGLGLELRMSNNDFVTAQFLENVGTRIYDWHPGASLEACLKLRRVGEFSYMREQQEVALHWIRDHPARFATLTAQHAWSFWVPMFQVSGGTVASIRRLIAGAASLFAWIGLLITIRRREWIAATVLTSALVAYPALFYLVLANARYRQPIEPMLIFAAVYGVSAIGAGFIRRSVS